MVVTSKSVFYLGHIHVVQKIHERFITRRSVITTGLFLQRFFQYFLQHLCNPYVKRRIITRAGNRVKNVTENVVPDVV